MNAVNFYLDRGVITLWYSFPVKRFRFSLKEKILSPQKNWDHKKQRVKSGHPNSAALNNYLDQLVSLIDELRIDCRVKDVEFSPSLLKSTLLGRSNGKVNNFHDYAVLWLGKKSGVTSSTIQTYRVSLDRIREALPDLSFNSVSRFTHDDLLSFMKGRGYKQNYINRVFKVFRSVLSDAYIDGVHENKFHLTRGFVPGVEDVDSIYLSLEDIDKIFTFWKSSGASPHLINAANIFLRGCFTGQRWQSFSKITGTMVYEFRGTKMINLRQKKTGVAVSVPVSNRLMELLGQEVHQISRQRLSDYIKEVCRVAGVPSWSLVSTHTARRSFATNMILAGVDLTKVMSITGHRTEKEFRKYVKIDQVINAQRTVADVNLVFG